MSRLKKNFKTKCFSKNFFFKVAHIKTATKKNVRQNPPENTETYHLDGRILVQGGSFKKSFKFRIFICLSGMTNGSASTLNFSCFVSNENLEVSDKTRLSNF